MLAETTGGTFVTETRRHPLLPLTTIAKSLKVRPYKGFQNLFRLEHVFSIIGINRPAPRRYAARTSLRR
jgi:hypothetical protein